ncbi:MAG: ABC transporter permease, partial [Deltaproteobacteria bacterium]|nr:ABC transporter permease [Deltaproteobacteria bacterium]
MQMLRLATRNLFRNTRRTVLTGLAIAFGLSMMVFTATMQRGQHGMMIDTAIRQMAGHVVVQGKGYQEEKKPTLVVARASEVAAALRAAYPDGVVAPRILVDGLLLSASNRVGAVVSGVDPESEATVSDLDDKLVEGAWLDDDPRGIVIGVAMADALAVEIGDKVVYMGQRAGDEVQSSLFRVKGIFRTGAVGLDGFFAVTSLESAQELIGGGDVANQVTLHLDDPDGATEARERVEALLARPDLEVLHWRDALPELWGFIQVYRVSSDFGFAFLGVIVGMGVLCTMLMNVLERTREFGVVLAMGMKPRQIVRLVLTEAFMLGVLGAVGGVVLGVIFSLPIVVWGIDLSVYAGGADTMEQAGVAIDTWVQGEWAPMRTCIYACCAVLLSV